MWMSLALLAFIALVAFAVIAACKFGGKFGLSVAGTGGILILTAFVIFFRQM